MGVGAKSRKKTHIKPFFFILRKIYSTKFFHVFATCQKIWNIRLTGLILTGFIKSIYFIF